MSQTEGTKTYQDYFAEKNYDKALSIISQQLTSSSEPNLTLEYNRDVCLFLKDKQEDANQFIQNLTRFYNQFHETCERDDPDAFLASALALFVNNQFQSAIDSFKNVAEKWLETVCNSVFQAIDKNTSKLSKLSKEERDYLSFLYDAYKILLQCYVDNSKNKKKNSLSNDIIINLKNHPCYSYFTAYIAYLRSRLDFNRGNYLKSLKSLDFFIDDKNKNCNYSYYLSNGNCQFMTSHFSLALSYYYKAVEYSPDTLHSSLLYKNIALAYMANQDYIKASSYFNKYLGLFPYNPSVWLRLGETYLMIYKQFVPKDSLIDMIINSQLYLTPTSTNSIGQSPRYNSIFQSKPNPNYNQYISLYAIQCFQSARHQFITSSTSTASPIHPYLVSDNKTEYQPSLHCTIYLAYCNLLIRNPSDTILLIDSIYHSPTASSLPSTLNILLHIYYTQACILLGNIPKAFEYIDPLVHTELYIDTYLSIEHKSQKSQSNSDKQKQTLNDDSPNNFDPYCLGSTILGDSTKYSQYMLYHLAVTYYLMSSFDKSLDVLNNIIAKDNKFTIAIKLYYIVLMRSKGEHDAGQYMLNKINPLL
ncbi:hypothetical protein WA158_003861 [Blastocystis sp. Blastoise]